MKGKKPVPVKHSHSLGKKFGEDEEVDMVEEEVKVAPFVLGRNKRIE